MAAIITKRVRHLDPVFKSIPLKKDEPKFHNSNEFEIKKVLTALAETDVAIVSITVDKHDYDSVYYDLRGNKLYKRVLYDLLELSLSSISGTMSSYSSTVAGSYHSKNYNRWPMTFQPPMTAR